jgi:phage terminase large subunit-like protein
VTYSPPSSPADPRSPAERLAALPEIERARFLDSLTEGQAAALLHDWRGFHARPAQIAPPGDWRIWLALAGRGFGKTRLGAEWVREMVAARKASRIALIAETAADARDVMVEGPSGILAVHPPRERPIYEPSKRRVTWPNGAVATLFNAVEPDQLRGPQFDCAWSDELAKWRYAQETWDMLQFGLRLGLDPRQLVTTTPRAIAVVRELVARAARGDAVVVTRGRTQDNRANLAAGFISEIEARYAGTRLGRQELDGEILDDAPGALWTRRGLDEWRRREAPPLTRIVVAVDPPATSGEAADECGIVCAAIGDDGRGYVLADRSMRGTPEAWARRVVSTAHEFEADRVVAEVNNGGEMVASVLRAVAPGLSYREVRATRGKAVRAEPISALYEQGRVSHVGAFPALEDQLVMITAAGYEGSGSPDRADALVWALTELFPSMTAPAPKVDWSQAFKAPAGTSTSWMAG